MSSTLTDTDMIIVDIDNLIHKEKKGIGGGGGHESCDESETEQTENFFLVDEPISDPILDNQILKNLNQLETLVRVIRKRIVGNDLFSFELTRLDYLNARLNNMIELFEFYQAKRLQTSVSNFQNELKFIQYILITRLNKLNSLFNMNQIDNFVLRKRDSENDCILNESPTEIKVLGLSNRKLRINSIQLEEQECCESENGDQTNTVDFMCAVYQFDNSNELKQLKQSLINASVVTTVLPLKTKTSKRSSSADNYNSTLKRKLRQSRLQNSKSKLDQLEFCQQQQLNDAQTVIDKMDDSFKLDEKCIAINSFKFKLKNSTHINECIQLESNCTHLKIIVYKLIKLRTTGTNKTTSSNNQYKNPIKYVSINLAADTKSTTNSFELIKSFKLDLKSFFNTSAKRIINSSRRSASKKETASSMLKRMFTKTKPSPLLETNHMNHVSRTSSQSAYDTERSNRINSTLIAFSKNEPHLSFECFIDMEISDSFSEQLIYDLDILNMNSLESWLALWRSDLKFSRNLKSSADNFEILTVYLNKIESSLDAVAEDDEWFYFIQIKIETKIQDPTNGTNLSQSVNVFRSNLFRLNESINDLCRIPFEDGDLTRTSANEKILKFDLYRVDRTDMIRMVASNSVNLCQSRHYLTQLNELHLGHAVRFSNLKIKFSFQSVIYPMRRVAIDLFEFNLDSQNANRLLSLVEIFLNSKQSNNEWILMRKFLEFFLILNDPAQLACTNSTKIVNDVMTNRRMIRDLLIEKLFEAFLRIISKNDSTIDMKLIVSGLKYSPNQLKLLSQFLANQVKSQFMERFTELTVKCFDKLIELIVYLSLNKSKYELKYEINDLITKTLKMDSIDLKQQAVVYSNLKLDFVNLLIDLYSPYELADLIITKILSNNQNTHDAKETLILSFVNKNIFQLEFFKQNNQFRNRLVTFLIRTHLEKSFKLSSDHLELLKNLLRNKSQLSKQNLEDMIKRLLKELINQLVNILKLNENLQEKKSLVQKESLVTLTINSFLCLFDILKIVPDIKSLNKEFIGSLDLNCLFEIIIFYLKNSAKIASTEQIQLKMNTIAIKFANYIQKHLQFYQITKNETDQSALIHSYFEMLFSFVNQSNVTFSLTMYLKHRMIRTIRSFWQSLGAQLKHSINLNEFLINKLCKCFMFNFYFKLFEFKPAAAKPISSNTHVYLSPFIGQLSSDSFVCKFYEECIGMLVDIYTVNCGSLFELEHLNEFILFNLMNWILSKENNAESRLSFCSNISSVSSQCESASSVSSNDFEFEFSCETQKPIINKSIRNYSQQIMELIQNIVNAKQNDSDAIRRSILASMCVCIDHNLLKDECNEISTIENFLITYDLIKIVDDLNTKSVNKLFTCLAYLNENRRQIKMYLLDDLYGMYKSEKNFLQMSFVRKQQAELVEWNLNRKNESDLKEIFSLKSSKKFVINSLNDSLLQVSVVTPYATSSISASSFSSSSSSSSSSISLGVPSSTATSATGLSSSLNCNTQLFNNTSNNSEISSSECFHHSDEVGKQIGAYYEKIDENYSKLSRILSAESKFASKSLNGQLYKNINVNTGLQYHGNLYFRIGIFGSSFKSKSIQNKYFLYKHHSYEMLSNIQNLIINKLAYSNIKEANIVILHHNQEPDASIKENKENKCYLQLCAVNRLEKHKLIELIEEMNQCKETVETLNKLTGEKYEGSDFYYYFDRPFYLRNNCSSNEKANKSTNRIMDEHTKENESVENLWLERSILITDECSNKFETNLTQFEEVKNTHKILLNPLRNAINDINEKTKELKQFIAHFKSTGSVGLSYSSQIHNLQPLTMRLLGCLDARVNGGLIKYVKELFTQNLIESKSFNKKKLLFDNLYISIKDQLDVLKVGLNLHDGILKELNTNNRKFSDDHHDSNNNVKNQKNYEHMNQLNGHLVDCFKLIDNELNERWSVAYSKLN